MSLKPGVEIGEEVHPHTSQFIRVESGHGSAMIDGKRYRLSEGDFLLIPPGSVHNVRNTSRRRELKLYTIYSPPHHPPNLKERKHV
jgi:mannose-6-phosphate isomerase-like protein (cupin superfamily)